MVDVKMYTEYNHLEKNFKCYGHPCMPQHNWVTVQVGDCVMLAQCMLFFDLPEGSVIDSPIYTADQGGAHVLVHFIQYNIYDQPPVGLKLYGMTQRDFCQDEDSLLIRGWSKHTAVINELMVPGVIPEPTLCMIPVSCILDPITGIHDPGAYYPHSWLFIPPQAKWANCFVDRMSHHV